MSNYRILKFYEQTLMKIEDIIGSGITNNILLDKLGYATFGNDYLGTNTSDNFPKYIKNNQCFILNTDSSKKPGTHWVGFYKINDKLYYYDSFRRSKKELSKFWKNKRMYNANKTDRDQSYNETDCGSRSFAFLVLMRRFGERAIDVV